MKAQGTLHEPDPDVIHSLNLVVEDPHNYVVVVSNESKALMH